MNVITCSRRDAGIQVLFAAVYAVAALLGRATVIDGQTLSLIWPAAGIGVLWMWWAVSRSAGVAAVGLVALGAVVAAAHLVTGASPALAAAFVAANTVQAVVAVLLMRPALRPWAPGGRDRDPSPGSGPAAVSTARGTAAMLVAAVTATGAGVVVGAAGFWVVLGDQAVDADLVWAWWGRNLAGTVLIVGTGLLALERRRGARSGRGPAQHHVRARTIETAAITVAALGCFAVFDVNSRSFAPLLGLTLWAAVRYTPLAVAAFTSTCGAGTVALTTLGLGPFDDITSVQERALSVQLFVAALATIGLVVSAAMADQRRLLVAQQAAERHARGQADLYTAVAEAMEDGVIVKDAQGHVIAVNAAAERLVHATPGRPTGIDGATLLRTDGSLLPYEEFPSVLAMRDGHAPPRDLVLHKKGSPAKVLSVSATRLPDDVAVPSEVELGDEWDLGPSASGGTVIIYRDVTTDRSQRDELAGFAGTVAHDLRGPLTAVRGWVELSQAEAEALGRDSDLALWLHKAYDATDRMGELIDDLLQHASSSGQALRLVDIDLNRVAAEVVALHGAEETVTVDPLPLVWADEVLVRHLLANLIGNALKYVEPGVVPHVRVAGRITGDGVTITVTDNGIGVPADERTAVFDQFHRAHVGRDEFMGTGLGLAVCHNIIERHGGRIAVGPAPSGTGSRFTFTLPRSARSLDAARRRGTAPRTPAYPS